MTHTHRDPTTNCRAKKKIMFASYGVWSLSLLALNSYEPQGLEGISPPSPHRQLHQLTLQLLIHPFNHSKSDDHPYKG